MKKIKKNKNIKIDFSADPKDSQAQTDKFFKNCRTTISCESDHISSVE